MTGTQIIVQRTQTDDIFIEGWIDGQAENGMAPLKERKEVHHVNKSVYWIEHVGNPRSIYGRMWLTVVYIICFI